MGMQAHEHLVLLFSMNTEVGGSMSGLAQRPLGQLHNTPSEHAMQLWGDRGTCFQRLSKRLSMPCLVKLKGVPN